MATGFLLLCASKTPLLWCRYICFIAIGQARISTVASDTRTQPCLPPQTRPPVCSPSSVVKTPIAKLQGVLPTKLPHSSSIQRASSCRRVPLDCDHKRQTILWRNKK